MKFRALFNSQLTSSQNHMVTKAFVALGDKPVYLRYGVRAERQKGVADPEEGSSLFISKSRKTPKTEKG